MATKRLPFSISQFNRNIEEITSKGYTYPTQMRYESTIHSRILVPPELKGAGKVRTYKEAIEYANKRGVDLAKFYSHDDYIQELKELKEYLGKKFTPKGFYQDRRENYKAQIEDAFQKNYTDGYDIESFTTEELREVLNEAWKRAKDDPDGSPTFYEHLMEVLKEWGAGQG